MNSVSRSSAATQLLRSLIERSGLDMNRITIGHLRSVDWQSLTFAGERHEIALRLTEPDATPTLARLRYGLAEAEWQLSGHVVADILIVNTREDGEGAILVEIEALTLTDQP